MYFDAIYFVHFLFFFFNDTATTEIYTLSLHDALPIFILAADQFIVKRSLPEEADGRSIIAGYHWFGDWGRDTMIALPGLTLTTGRADIARKILLAFARYVDGGMLPNDFPDARSEEHTS